MIIAYHTIFTTYGTWLPFDSLHSLPPAGKGLANIGNYGSIISAARDGRGRNAIRELRGKRTWGK